MKSSFTKIIMAVCLASLLLFEPALCQRGFPNFVNGQLIGFNGRNNNQGQPGGNGNGSNGNGSNGNGSNGNGSNGNGSNGNGSNGNGSNGKGSNGNSGNNQPSSGTGGVVAGGVTRPNQPAQSAPAQSAPAQSAPAKSPPAQSAPAQSPPAQSPPAQSPPAQSNNGAADDTTTNSNDDSSNSPNNGDTSSSNSNSGNSDLPDASQVKFTTFKYGGSGCPDGSVASTFTPDRTAFTLIFSEYEASFGSGVAATENRKNCQINLGVHYPQGFQFSVAKATYKGYGSLDAGLTGTQKSTYYFTGAASNQGSRESTFTGPYDQDYSINDDIAFTSVVWSPCGADGLLNINSQVRIQKASGAASDAQGLLTTDSLDGKFELITGLQWRRCTN